MLIKKGVFQQKVHWVLLFIREFFNHTHTQLFCSISFHGKCFVNVCWGWATSCTLRILHILDKKSNSKWRWSWSNKNRHDTHPDLKWPLIFVVKIKTQLYGYFCGKDKSPAILLTLLVLALLQRKLSTVLSPTKPFDPSFPQLQYFFD